MYLIFVGENNKIDTKKSYDKISSNFFGKK